MAEDSVGLIGPFYATKCSSRHLASVYRGGTGRSTILIGTSDIHSAVHYPFDVPQVLDDMSEVASVS